MFARSTFVVRSLVALSILGGLSLATAPGLAEPDPASAPVDEEALAALGKQLFFDPNFSRNRSQSCATCHDPAHAFTDPREGKAGRAVSVGDDGASHGDRNTPTLAYVSLSPPFHRTPEGEYAGGQFWDGRADDLRAQAGQPMLNPVEMSMPSEAEVLARVVENPDYVAAIKGLFGVEALDDVENGFDAVARALAAYQSSPALSPFDSKYDRFLRGEAELTAEEAFGRSVFLSWNCQTCHLLRDKAATETFTSFEYHNIGVPVNAAARTASALGVEHIDHGLLGREGIDDPRQDGKFKTPTLRNVAVTGPYMHNGVFEDLRTAIVFYNKYTSRTPGARINPETGQPWGPPEVADNLSLRQLSSGLALDDARVNALIAFLETLTDAQYMHLLEPRDAGEHAVRPVSMDHFR